VAVPVPGARVTLTEPAPPELRRSSDMRYSYAFTMTYRSPVLGVPVKALVVNTPPLA